MPIQDLLQSIGLSEKEVQVYIAVLQMQPAKASNIALRAEITRPTAYDILDSLIKKKLVYMEERRGIKYFTAHQPEALVEYIENKVYLFEEYKRKARNLLPKLHLLKAPEFSRPDIQFFESEQALNEITRIIKQYKYCKVFFDSQTYKKAIENIFKQSFPHTHIQILCPDAARNRKFLSSLSYEGKTLIDEHNYRSDTLISGPYMMILHYEPEIHMTIIKNKDMSHTHQHIFESLWKIII